MTFVGPIMICPPCSVMRPAAASASSMAMYVVQAVGIPSPAGSPPMPATFLPRSRTMV
jgi:hypothetical protein